ncbi:MAG: substrate-binding domain-containing protein [Gammaproteobacteria bacterium]|nr:substrate-binding domain-containing protein [Gammaproteobacteria bacterium]MDH5800030.1 substrate-binding domain-containing protein [Gammaproteobacteria bacterium]
MKLFGKKTLLVIVFILICFPAQGSSAKNAITGAGAHFSWIVFDELESELEQLTGRKLNLYGQGSMMGVGCNAGIKTALKSTPEQEAFGFTCCPLSDVEMKKKSIQVYPIALEPILAIVNKDNPVQNLSEEQLRNIFNGKISNWKQVGGEDKPIIVVTRLHCKNRPGHWRLILPGEDDFVQKRLNVKSAAAMVEKVDRFSGAIGHIGSAWRFKPSDSVKPLSINGYEPSAANVKSRQYPFFRQLSAVTNSAPSDDVLRMIRYTQTSPTLQDIAKRYSLVPLAEQ